MRWRMARRLLLADDSITIQKVVELVLAEEDFEIKSVSNGEDALNLLDSFRPDIILADIEMPKVNGYQLCDKVRNNPSTAHIPVILLAGAFEPVDEELARQVKADDTVIKPFESQELISKINAILTISSAKGAEEEVMAVAEVSEEGEIFAFAEEAEALAEEEAVDAAKIEEDLWAMEEVPGTAEETGVEEALTREVAGLEEDFEISDRAYEAPLETPVTAETPGPHVMREAVLKEAAVLSREEMTEAFERSVRESVSSFLSTLDIRGVILNSLEPAMKESAEKVLWEIAPDIAEKMLKEILRGSIASLSAEVEKVIWETVPDLASSMISKEIEKIRSEF
jgi:DNA-binding response OmpR family regulator